MTLFYTLLSAAILGSALYVALNSRAKSPKDGALAVLGFITVFVLVYYSIQFLAPYFLRTSPGFTQRQFSSVFSGEQYQDITEQIGNTLQGNDPIRAAINSGGEQIEYTYADVVTATPAAPTPAAPAMSAIEVAPTVQVVQPVQPEPTPAPTQDPRVAAMIQELYTYKDAGNLPSGEIIVDQILALDPGNAVALAEKQSITAAWGVIDSWKVLGLQERGPRSKFVIRDGADITDYLRGFSYQVKSSRDQIGLSTEAEGAAIVVTTPGWLRGRQVLLARIHLVNLGAANEGDTIDLTGGQ
jgi:hypothetical protein